MQPHQNFDIITIKRKSDGKSFTVGENVFAGRYSVQGRVKAFRLVPSGNTVTMVADVLSVQGEFLESVNLDLLK